ncbi:ABC transporter permease [Aliiglaciecola sp. M165]|uniref:ABC transporter permease n=1 Tax=Aliiglaciecola sp. M165 TaxID=2593649 RepID=UPI001180FE69|nr:ABC transporter permease [Aliiglaciecola sp. M165]TRY30763.1 ABC transporter [Aliiglaciecola sp. M165]
MTTVIKRNKWEIWRDVIFALFAREIRTGFNDKFGLSWAVISPVVFIFILSFIRGRIGGADIHTIPAFTFMALGIVFIQSFLQTLGAAAGAIGKNKSLYAFRQVQPISAVVASGLFQFLVKLFVIFGIIVLMYFLGMEVTISNPLLFIYCYAVLWLFAMLSGLAFGISELFIPEIKKIRDLMTRPLFFISGVFFSLQDFPKDYWYLLDWNPILHAIELARFSVYSTYGSGGVSLNYLTGVTLVTFTLSLCVYHISWKQAISR